MYNTIYERILNPKIKIALAIALQLVRQFGANTNKKLIFIGLRAVKHIPPSNRSKWASNIWLSVAFRSLMSL